MIEDLLPAEVVTVAVQRDDPYARLFPAEAAQFEWAVESRIREFTTARTCAHQALSKLGVPVVPILRGPSGEPLWPLSVVGSITHCIGYRAAAVAMECKFLTVGIDAEVDDALPPGILDFVALEAEKAWLAKAPRKLHWDRLLFSAKECVYKAWFPLTGRWLDFKDVFITFDHFDQSFRAHILVTDPVSARDVLRQFEGRFLVRDGLILTAIAARSKLRPRNHKSDFRPLDGFCEQGARN